MAGIACGLMPTYGGASFPRAGRANWLLVAEEAVGEVDGDWIAI